MNKKEETMKALIVTTPTPACILRSGDPARAHDPIPLAETFARNTPPLQPIVFDDYTMNERSAHLDLPGEFA